MEQLLKDYLIDGCPAIHEARLNALLDVSKALQHSHDLCLSALGRKLSGDGSLKSKIKKADRLIGNKHLHSELTQLYTGLSKFVFTSHLEDIPIIVDLCFIKDDRAIQMLSAEVATKGRTIPLYRDVFSEGELSGRATAFLTTLKSMLPEGREIVFIMDAGFTVEWFKAIEELGWSWISRLRGIKSVKLSVKTDWISIEDFMPKIGEKSTTYNEALITLKHQYPCRIITTRRSSKGRKSKVSRGKISSKIASGAYNKSAKDPWILATNLPQNYNSVKIITLYEKRMQIEQSFRDIKSHQFGLSGRNVRTKNIYRWEVKMLLAAIVQITFWILGVIGHSQGMQKHYQSNTVKDRKVFSYFTLGKFIIEYDGLDKLNYTNENLLEIIEKELARKW
jgi:hypothetical protein